MEHNLGRYAKYYSCGSIKISRGSEFTKENDYSNEIFLDIGKQMLEISYTLNLVQLLKIALELKRYMLQKLKPKKTQNVSKLSINK
jgi:hypothetical protein